MRLSFKNGLCSFEISKKRKIAGINRNDVYLLRRASPKKNPERYDELVFE
jgi:hypothetical protein